MSKSKSLENRLSSNKKSSLLEKIVGSTTSILKRVAHYTYYTTKTLVCLGAVYLFQGAITLQKACIASSGYMTGKILGNLKNKIKTKYHHIANEGAVGAIGGAILHNIFTGIHYLSSIVESSYGSLAGLITKATLALAQLPIYMVAIHERLNRLMISSYKAVKGKEMLRKVKNAFLYLSAPIVANLTMVPPDYNIPVAAAISTGYGVIRSTPDKKQATPS